MSEVPPIHLAKAPGSAQQMRELVMAWASDEVTGEPIYILELGKDRTGARSGCVCPSCAQPLTAVNAAKSTFIKRPHFRHPNGTGKHDCAVVAARAALLQGLRANGWIDLPGRSGSSTAVGLSGIPYQALVERKPERVHISHVTFDDRAAAILHLKDGRRLKVTLRGAVEAHEQTLPGDVSLQASITLEVDDPEVALMDLVEIRKHLSLSSANICWQRHWDDMAIQAEAEEQLAQEMARFLDLVPEDLSLPDDMPADLKRETVLHFVVKEILEEVQELWAPGLEIKLSLETKSGKRLDAAWSLPAQRLQLVNVALEKRIGTLRPDLVCDAQFDGALVYSPLFIEVTVTNQIAPERASKLVTSKVATLELNISRLGGRVTRDQLAQMIVYELGHKRWIFNPASELKSQELWNELLKQRDRLDGEWEAGEVAHREALSASIRQLADDYLLAARTLLEILTEAERIGDHRHEYASTERTAQAKAQAVASKLAARGFPEALDEQLLAWHGTLAKVFSIQANRGIGYKFDSGFQVLNACFQGNGRTRRSAILCLVAAKAFGLPLSSTQQAKVVEWRTEIWASLNRGEEIFERDTRHDSFLALLFPKLSEGLARVRPEVIKGKLLSRQRRNSSPSSTWPGADIEMAPSQANKDAWLTGRALDDWIKANPESAQGLGLMPREN